MHNYNVSSIRAYICKRKVYKESEDDDSTIEYLQTKRSRSIINTVNTVMSDEKKPIFIRLKEEYERLIDIGAMKEGDAMPSVREVALMFNVNPNTVQRAFSLMVDDGYLESIPKKGFFIKEKKGNRLEHLKEMLKDIKDKGYSNQEIKKMLEDLEK